MASGDIAFQSQAFDVNEFMKNTGNTGPRWTATLIGDQNGEIVKLSGDDNLPTLTALKQYKVTIAEV